MPQSKLAPNKRHSKTYMNNGDDRVYQQAVISDRQITKLKRIARELNTIALNVTEYDTSYSISRAAIAILTVLSNELTRFGPDQNEDYRRFRDELVKPWAEKYG